MPRRSDFKPAPKPTLEGVLDHLGVSYRDTTRPQKVTCPLHHDRHPSMNVDLSRQLWNCISQCGGGSAWDLLMKHEHVDFKGAVRLAAELGLPTVTGEAARPPGRRTRSTTSNYTPSWRK